MDTEIGDGTPLQQKMDLWKERYEEQMDRAAATLQPHMERLIDRLTTINQRMVNRKRTRA